MSVNPPMQMNARVPAGAATWTRCATHLLATMLLLATAIPGHAADAPFSQPLPLDATVQLVPPPLPPGTSRLQALIVTGRNSHEHDWHATTLIIRRLLESTGRFEVRVTEDFRNATPEYLKSYDVVLLNYLGRWRYDQPDELRWGEQAERALFDYAKNGGGVVVYHASVIMGWPSWPEFERLAGGTMRPTPTQSRRNPADGFLVHIVDTGHPITAGMREFTWALEEDMYVNLRWDPATKVHVLATGRDDPAAYDARIAGPKYPASVYGPGSIEKIPGIGKEHPLVWTSDYGKGRVFVITLGHGPQALQNDGTTSLLTRGTEWAASGAVTIPLKEKARAYR